MIKFQNIKQFLSVCIFIFAFFNFNCVKAVELNLVSQTRVINMGQEFQADFVLNIEDEDINAIEGKIIFPEDLLELKEIKDGNSIVNLWIEKPKAKDREIPFSGIIPGGYLSDRGLIFSVVFKSIKEGRGLIEIRDMKVLLNDGKGTPVDVKISNFQFLIFNQIPISQILKPAIKDIESPETFRPEVASDESLFDGKYFLVFVTQDKGSGIDRYEVCEGKKKCVAAESPYLLQNQGLDEEIVVKAIDKGGNERVATLPPQKPRAWYKNYSLLVILIIAAVTLAYLIWKKRRK